MTMGRRKDSTATRKSKGANLEAQTCDEWPMTAELERSDERVDGGDRGAVVLHGDGRIG